MNKVLAPELIRGRIRSGHFGSSDADGLQGAFQIYGPCGRDLFIIACDGSDEEARGWEHVSVSMKTRTPNWTEMSFVKDLFWSAEETVLQFHPPKSAYINNHENCLHMWRQIGVEAELPPSILVGIKETA